MNENQQSKWQHILIPVVIIGAVLFGLKLYLDIKTDAYLALSNANIANQEEVIRELLNGLRTGGDAYQSAVTISDCRPAERIRFDELLSQLSTLQRGELLELDELFNACAYYFATIQTVSADQLRREVDIYLDMLRANAVLDSAAEEALEQSDVWNNIVAQEQERSQLHVDLVELQRSIVNELLAYKTAQHQDVQTLVAQAQEVRDNIIYMTQQIDQLRKDLNDT